MCLEIVESESVLCQNDRVTNNFIGQTNRRGLAVLTDSVSKSNFARFYLPYLLI